jgi:hypothetical protein
MSLAPLAYLLWTKVMKYNPKDPEWISRDRFVLSNGHACALLYRCVHEGRERGHRHGTGSTALSPRPSVVWPTLPPPPPHTACCT